MNGIGSDTSIGTSLVLSFQSYIKAGFEQFDMSKNQPEPR